jgi:hypothetical protein
MKLCQEAISREEFLKAIRDGVSQAMLTMTESGDGYTGPIIRDLLLHEIQLGVKEAIIELALDEKILDGVVQD